ncbi:uncharacterized protein LTR77_004682 [Saxophila tyrrhenica]|uniref:Uncharacterized protein n=1 Tax=Saxophila tyrrhenica TaxID=1690608 RepID=A0AAV9PAK3_9PEZI|nr:hypothetical protein LTR77_004682 [Saxophila tyrrhenica]
MANIFTRLIPGKGHNSVPQGGTRSTVVVPLYIYPLSEETYAPLYAAPSISIRSHPELRFLVILNPNSGPGAPPWWPDPGYVREIPRLNAHANVTTLGYVRIDYCKRSQGDVVDDIRAYGRWAADEQHPGTLVRGIFFDETPNHYTGQAARYLEEISREVRTATGIDVPRLVMHNPGTSPDQRLTSLSKPDVTAVCEESLEKYRSYTVQQQTSLRALPRTQRCIIMHTVPQSQIPTLVRELSREAAYLFITELGTGVYYQKWGSGWEGFVRSMAQLGA